MLAPAGTFTAAGRKNATLSAGPTATQIVGDIGFDASGNVLLDSNAVAGALIIDGIARTATNCMYGTTTTAASDVFLGALRISQSGQLVVAQANPLLVTNGDPFNASGAWCIA